ncbi:unnamed protein product [Trichobilharzia szidati]|nr:unnamed protein product [Trichobilharzia szidati]
MQNLLLQALLCLLLLLSNNNAFEEYYSYDDDLEDGAEKSFRDYDPKSTLNAYVDSYSRVADYKAGLIEILTYVNPQNVEKEIKPEILRLEHLYQSKWAKEFLESIGAEDKKLVNFYTDEYKKALKEDKALNYSFIAKRVPYNLMRKAISKKWERRKNLDIAEGAYFAVTSDNLKRDEVQIEMRKKDMIEANKRLNTYRAHLKSLETAAVIAYNAHKKNSKSLDAEKVYWKARSRVSFSTLMLEEYIKLLEMKRIRFLKFQTPEYRINWLLAEMKEDAKL